MKISANDIRVGNILEHDSRLWMVLKTMHTQPGKGGAYMQVEMKDIKAGTKLNTRFRSAEIVKKAQLDEKSCQFLYMEGDGVVFMCQDTFEQISVHRDAIIAAQLPFLREGMGVKLEMHNGEVISVTFPENVETTVSECEGVVRGQTVSSSYKPAMLDIGIRIMVPQFIESGDKILVKIATQEYLSRA